MVRIDKDGMKIKAAGTDAPVNDLPIKAAFDRYDSPFVQLVAPLIATRYFWLAIEDINPLNFLKKPDPVSRPDFKPWKRPGAFGYMSRNFAAFGMGATFLGIIGLYSRNTLHDIKSLYSEAVGYELGKRKEDVTLGDIFFRSENAALGVTRGAYVRRTLARMATAATFFFPWQIFRDFKHDQPKYDANANAGVGAIGLYLLGEGFLREPSFFDTEQNMVRTTIHHAEAKAYKIIRPENIQALLILQRRHLNKHYQQPEASSKEGQNELTLATRIADLLNQTYHNAPRTEKANLTLGKFNFLVGFRLLDSFPSSLAFVELAGRSADMKEVKQAAAAIKNGAAPQEVFRQYGIDVNAAYKSDARATAPPTPAETTFTQRVGKPEKRKPPTPQTHVDFAEKPSGRQPNV